MTNKDLLNNIKKLREMTGVGFNECKGAIETHDRCGDISDFSTSEISCDKYEVYM